MKRFRNPGRLTNYEMEWLRAHPKRTRRWAPVWASVSEVFHPKSLEDWQRREGVSE